MHFQKSLLSLLLLCCSFALLVDSCQFHGETGSIWPPAHDQDIYENISTRPISNITTKRNRTAITNVRVFDGFQLLPPSTVFIDEGKIGLPCGQFETCTPAEVYDAKGMTLLPGLIDSHAHPSNSSHLHSLTRFGVTTTVNAFCVSPAMCDSLSGHIGLTSIVKASFIATSPNSSHARLVGKQGAPFLIHNTSQAQSFVRQQVAQGADFVKVIGSAPKPGLTQAEQNALVIAAHEFGKAVILHTSSYEAFLEGLRAGADQIHHSTLDRPVEDDLVELFVKEGTIACPTLTMMRATVEQLHPSNSSYEAAALTVARLHKAGVPIIAGTDANMQANVPATVPYGISLHDELKNLVDAGLSPIEALNAATSLLARYFGLTDRDVIEQNMRADLLLVDGDPTADITSTRNVVNVWVDGVPYHT